MPCCFMALMRCTCSRVFNTSKGHTNVAVRAPAQCSQQSMRGLSNFSKKVAHSVLSIEPSTELAVIGHCI
eukprot:1161564-Pelagomonas_calceolata.AAC.6